MASAAAGRHVFSLPDCPEALPVYLDAEPVLAPGSASRWSGGLWAALQHSSEMLENLQLVDRDWTRPLDCPLDRRSTGRRSTDARPALDRTTIIRPPRESASVTGHGWPAPGLWTERAAATGRLTRLGRVGSDRVAVDVAGRGDAVADQGG